MTDPKQIPHLIRLLDDESEEIQNYVRKELISFGPILDQQLQKLHIHFNDVQQKHLNLILESRKILTLKQGWSRWFYIQSQTEKLETALSTLAIFLSADAYPKKLKHLLDSLAWGYRQKFDYPDSELLAHYLFRYLGFKGNEEDYYDPQNSNLIYVIKNRKGIPISLTALYMLVGIRLGLVIEGCPFPGHFLATIKLHGQKVFVDCFNEGQILTKKDLLVSQQKYFKMDIEVLEQKTSVETMVGRFLANLIRSYQIQENKVYEDLVVYLFKELDKKFLKPNFNDLTPESILNTIKITYQAGNIVENIKFCYKAIVVDVDLVCCAEDSWYYSNLPLPSRDQPWYHILIDGTDEVAYVAQSDLIFDNKTKEITHPLVSYFFTISVDGEYVRNNNEWPEGSDS